MSDNKPKPRITVNMLNERLTAHVEASAATAAGLHERINGAKATVEAIQRQLTAAQHHIKELQRSKNGTTLANKRVAQMESELSRLTARLGAIDSASEADPVVAKVDQQKLERINTRLEDLFGRSAGEVSELREQVDTLASQVDGHEVAIGMLNEGQNSLNERVDDVHHRVTVLETLEEKAPWWKLVLGAAIGIVAGILWLNFFNYSQTETLPDGQKVTIYYEPARVVGAWLIGIAVALFVTWLALSLTKRQARRSEHIETTSTPPSVRTVQVASREGNDAPTAPTKVYATSGADTGAR